MIYIQVIEKELPTLELKFFKNEFKYDKVYVQIGNAFDYNQQNVDSN